MRESRKNNNKELDPSEVIAVRNGITSPKTFLNGLKERSKTGNNQLSYFYVRKRMGFSVPRFSVP